MNPLNDFLDGPKTIAGLRFRPVTMGSNAICEQLGLTLFTGSTKELIPQSDEEQEREAKQQIVAFTWLHSHPLPEVLAAIRNGTSDAAIQEFAFSLLPSHLPVIVAEINRISTASAAASIEVAPKPGGSDNGAPGN